GRLQDRGEDVADLVAALIGERGGFELGEEVLQAVEAQVAQAQSTEGGKQISVDDSSVPILCTFRHQGQHIRLVSVFDEVLEVGSVVRLARNVTSLQARWQRLPNLRWRLHVPQTLALGTWPR